MNHDLLSSNTLSNSDAGALDFDAAGAAAHGAATGTGARDVYVAHDFDVINICEVPKPDFELPPSG